MPRTAIQSSALESPVFRMVAIGAIVTERTEKVSPDELPALSVGRQGVTPQLEGVAKQTTDGSRKRVREGDLVINTRADRRGASGLAGMDGSVSLVYSVLQLNKSLLNPRFGHHLLRSVAFQEEFFRWGTGIVDDLWSTNFTRMSRIAIPLPPRATQQRIADYLDRETGEIDAMLAKMDELTETLEARRTSMIQSCAGTGFTGLQNSIRSLQWVASLATGSTPAGGRDSNFSEVGGVGWVTPEDLGSTILPTRFLNDAGAKQIPLIPAGSVLLCAIGATLGKAGFTHEKITTNQQITAIMPDSDTCGRYLYYAILAEKDQIVASSMTTTLPIINNARLREVRIRVPGDVDEQRRIADHLDEVTGKIDQMLAKTAELKSLLIERRSALITDVVTGKKQVHS